MRLRPCLALAALGLLAAGLAARPTQEPGPEVRTLEEGLTLLTGDGGGNALVLRVGDETLLVDTRLVQVRAAR